MPGFLKAALVFIAGLLFTWAATMAVYVAGSGLGWWNDRDGGVAMGFAFTIGPLLGAIAGIALAIYVARRSKRLAAQSGATDAVQTRWPRGLRVPLAAIIAGGATYLAGILVFWIFWPYSGSSFTSMGQFLWHAPAFLGVIAALAAAIREARR